MSATEAAWELLAHYLDLPSRLAAGEAVRVTAEDIKKITGREPRLMTKFDSRSQRPKALKSSTILPIKNGEYIVLPGDGYHSVESADETENRPLPSRATKLLSLPWTTGPSSESQLLDMALASGVLHAFLEEEELYLTVRGRLRAHGFEFGFQAPRGTINIRSEGVQVEVDGGLEGAMLSLFEAKLGARSDFHVRQLYYPFRMWRYRLLVKQTWAVFMCYSDRVMSLRLYDFVDELDYSSIRLKKALDVTVGETEVELDLAEVLGQVAPEPSPLGMPFPQADDMAKVIELLDATAAGVVSLHDTVQLYGFTERQAAYYPTAARYLGLLQIQGPQRVLSPLGTEVANANRSRRHELIIRRLAALPVFRETLKFAVSSGGDLPGNDVISEWIEIETERAGVPLSGATLARRASTVRAWVRWALNVVSP